MRAGLECRLRFLYPSSRPPQAAASRPREAGQRALIALNPAQLRRGWNGKDGVVLELKRERDVAQPVCSCLRGHWPDGEQTAVTAKFRSRAVADGDEFADATSSISRLPQAFPVLPQAVQALPQGHSKLCLRHSLLRQAVRVSLRELLMKKVRFKTGGCAGTTRQWRPFRVDHVVMHCRRRGLVSDDDVERWSRHLVSGAKEHAAGFGAAMGKEGGSGSGQ
jgi:hypothetical protein